MTDKDFDQLLDNYMDFKEEDIDNTQEGKRKEKEVRAKQTSLRTLANKINKKGL